MIFFAELAVFRSCSSQANCAAKSFVFAADIVQSDQVDPTIEICGVNHGIGQGREINAGFREEFLLESSHLEQALRLWKPDDSESFNLMIAHGRVERNVAQVRELRQKTLVDRRRELQITEEEEGLSATPICFLEGPGDHMSFVVPRIAADGDADYALGRLVRQGIRMLVQRAAFPAFYVG